MIFGVGTDVLRIERIRAACEDSSDPFLKRTYTENERGEALKRRLPIYYYATRFAGKEAVFKALRLSPEEVDLSEIEILTDSTGAPYITFYGALRDFTKERGIAVHLSLSYESEEAVAFAVAEIETREAFA